MNNSSLSYLTNSLNALARRAALLLLVLLGASAGAAAQRLQEAGVAASFSMGQTLARQTRLDVAQFQLQTDIDGSRLDDTGNRFSAYARVGLGVGRLFVQPEVAYSSVLGQAYGIAYYSQPTAPWPNLVIFTPRLQRFEVAALAGLRLGRRGYLLAGPVLAYNLRETYGPETGGEVYVPLVQSLYRSVRPVQLLAQAGIGMKIWRFDLNARYEHSLTPYTQRFTYAGQTYDYHQATSQVILNLGFLLFDAHRPWRAD
ncbi:outer membrane beta-barrel protein [Hymenobacter sp. M29]|uniref:Outer membrane beta-barrel protein n=1 Tax=Hymenobacter mellowenesis TaxID=3063995 RepID=A0ABT9AGS2_9BACT|nr:outer membrane beta-barrel protein [Hymenobacter sp. M29]MDO7847882.1 outer membrane beta-barrel protein [Hymenobacter sp. M29]